jgi:hypothetical protein
MHLQQYELHPAKVYAPGEVTQVNTTGSTVCTMGEHYAGHHHKCMACEPGSYCVYEYRYLCPAGKYQPSTHASECLRCVNGTYQVQGCGEWGGLQRLVWHSLCALAACARARSCTRCALFALAVHYHSSIFANVCTSTPPAVPSPATAR